MKKLVPLVATLFIGILLGAILFRSGGGNGHDHALKEKRKDGVPAGAADVWTC